MKMYRKKLNSLEELQREKIRLRYERRHLQAEDLNPLPEWGRNKISGAATSGLLGTLIALVSSDSKMQTALALGKPIWNALRKRRPKKRQIRYAAGLPREKSVAKKIITEIAVNYLIGKAVQLSVKGIRSFVKRKKKAKKLERMLYS